LVAVAFAFETDFRLVMSLSHCWRDGRMPSPRQPRGGLMALAGRRCGSVSEFPALCITTHARNRKEVEQITSNLLARFASFAAFSEVHLVPLCLPRAP
jgi:hypothetical protein